MRLVNIKNLKWVFVFLLVFTLGADLLSTRVNASPEPTLVGGVINTNTIWTKSNSPYLFEDDLHIASGKKLTIESGVAIDFSMWSIIVDGELRVLGKKGDEVVLNITEESLQGYKNARIYFTSSSKRYSESSNTGCLISYANITCYEKRIIHYGVIEGGYIKLSNSYIYEENFGSSHYTVNSKGIIEDCTFERPCMAINLEEGRVANNKFIDTQYGFVIRVTGGEVLNNILDGGQHGISARGGYIFNNTIKNMSYNGINMISGGGPIVKNNLILNCRENGLDLTGETTSTIENNLITECSVGIHFWSSAFPNNIMPKSIKNNNFIDNELNVYAEREDPRITVNLEGNYWGSQDESTIGDSIHANNVDSRLCKIDFIPYLLEPKDIGITIPSEIVLDSTNFRYNINDIITISGISTPVLDGQPISIRITSEAGRVQNHIINLDEKGTFSFNFTALMEGSLSIDVRRERNALYGGSSIPPWIIEIEKKNSTITSRAENWKVKLGESIRITGDLTPNQDEIVVLTILTPDGETNIQELQCDDRGRYEYRIEASLEGEWLFTSRWDGDEEYGACMSREIKVQVSNVADLKIVVRDDSGLGIKLVKVTPTQQPDDDVYETYTNSDGEILFTDIQLGSYKFEVTHSDFENTTAEISVDGSSITYEIILETKTDSSSDSQETEIETSDNTLSEKVNGGGIPAFPFCSILVSFALFMMLLHIKKTVSSSMISTYLDGMVGFSFLQV